MEFDWSSNQRDLRDRTVAFARSLAPAPARDVDHTRQWRERWDACGQFGLLGLCVPEQWGGMGLDSLSSAAVVEAFGLGCEDMGLVFAAAAHLFACVAPVAQHGSGAQRERWLRSLAQGSCIGANAITEAEAGSDVFSLRTSARREGDCFVLNGVKSYVTNAPVADLFLVYASTAPSHGYMGVTAFLVPRGAPGLRVGAPIRKSGLGNAPMASVYLEDCVVAAQNLLGGEGKGAALFTESMSWERTCLFAAYLGAMQRTLDRCVEHARTRQQFRKAIGKNQAISHRLADMKVRLEGARLLLYRACWLRDQGREASAEVSMAKLAVSEAAVQAGLDAVQIFGAAGVTEGSGMDGALLDALPARIFSGTSEIQRDIIAARLGL